MSVLQITFVPLLFSRFIWPSCVLQQRQRGVDDKEGGEEQRGEQAHIKTDVTLDLLSAHICPLICILFLYPHHLSLSVVLLLLLHRSRCLQRASSRCCQ